MPDPAETTIDSATTPGSAAPESPGGDPASDDPTVVLQAEVSKWKDLALRGQAELDNFRKRMSREAIDVRRFAAAALIEDLLPVLDNFEFGLQAARAESQNSPITLGMTMVRKQLDDFLTAQGVREIQAEGQVFDPTLHEAVSTEARPELPEGVIVRVVRRGYLLHDRVLRAPAVVVSGAADTHSK